MLLNQVLTNFDRELRLFCEGMGITYTRYADDMTFSSPDRIDEMLVADIGERLASVGLQLNAKKTRFMGLNEQKIVTGLVLGAGRVNLPAPYLNSVRGWIGRLERLPELSKADAEKLRGTLCMIREVGGNRSGDLCARGFRLLG